MIKRYGWFNKNEDAWQVGDKNELDFLRRNNTELTNVEFSFCGSKKATRKFEFKILSKNKTIA